MLYDYGTDGFGFFFLIDKFSWLHRVKAVLGITSLLKLMHGCRPLPYRIRNISAAHIIVDSLPPLMHVKFEIALLWCFWLLFLSWSWWCGEQDYNAKIFDFSMISGGILADMTELLINQHQGCYGYIDPDYVRPRYINSCFKGWMFFVCCFFTCL